MELRCNKAALLLPGVVLYCRMRAVMCVPYACVHVCMRGGGRPGSDGVGTVSQQWKMLRTRGQSTCNAMLDAVVGYASCLGYHVLILARLFTKEIEHHWCAVDSSVVIVMAVCL